MPSTKWTVGDLLWQYKRLMEADLLSTTICCGLMQQDWPHKCDVPYLATMFSTSLRLFNCWIHQYRRCSVSWGSSSPFVCHNYKPVRRLGLDTGLPCFNNGRDLNVTFGLSIVSIWPCQTQACEAVLQDSLPSWPAHSLPGFARRGPSLSPRCPHNQTPRAPVLLWPALA